MARPEYTGVPDASLSAPSGDYLRVQDSPAAFGGNIAEGAAALGQGAMSAVRFYGEVAADHAANEFQKRADAIVYGDPGQPQRDPDGNPVVGPDNQPMPDVGLMGLKGAAALQAAPHVNQRIDDLLSETRATLGSAAQQEKFDQFSRRYRQMLNTRMSEHLDSQANAWYGEVYKNTYENALAGIANDPTDEQGIGQLADRMRTAAVRTLQLRGLGNDKEATAGAMRRVDNDVTEMRIKALAPRDPSAALDLLNKNQGELAASGKYDGLVNQVSNGVVADYEAMARHDTASALKLYNDNKASLPKIAQDRLESFFVNKEYTDTLRAESQQRRADAAEEKAASTVRVGLSRDLQNATAMVSSGLAPTTLPTDDRITAAFPKDPARADEVRQQVSDLRDIGGAVAQLPNMSPQEIEKKSAELRPNAAEPQAFDKKARLFNIWNRAVEGHVKALHDDPAGAVMASPGAHPDITTSWAALEQIKDPQQFATVFADYASHTLGTQAMLGVPEDRRSVLPKSVAQGVANNIESNAQQAPATIKQLQVQYGAAWPTAWRDLVVHGKLSPMYQSVATLDDERDGALLSQWIQGGKDTKRNVAELVGGDKAFKGINDAVDASPDLQSLSRSLYRSGASQSMVGNVMQSVKELAYAKAANGMPDSAEYAIKAFTSKYEFMPNGGARVPAKVFDAVTQNAAAAVSGLKLEGVTVPPIFGQQGAPKPEEYIDMIKAAPTWITTPNADGVLLMDHYGRFVRGADGQPIKVPFDAQAPATKPLEPRQEFGR